MSLDGVLRTFSAAIIGAVAALAHPIARAQTTPLGTPAGTSVVSGAPGTVSGTTVVPNGPVGSVPAPGVEYGASAPSDIGYVSTPSITTMGAANPIGSGAVQGFSTGGTVVAGSLAAAASQAVGLAGQGSGFPATPGTAPALGLGFPGTSAASATGWTGVPRAVGTNNATIDGYGSGLTTNGYAPFHGAPAQGASLGPGLLPIGAGFAVPGAPYFGGLYVGDIYDTEGLLP
jgi:hypothetical protein